MGITEEFSCYVYSDEGLPKAWCHDPYAAAAILSGIGGKGWQAKWRKRVLWDDGKECAGPDKVVFASESLDACADTIRSRFLAAKAEVAANKSKRRGDDA